MARKAILVAQGLDGWIRLDMGKGCILKLKAAAYYQGIADGKAERRALAQAHREAQAQAMRQADTLAWIDEEAP